MNKIQQNILHELNDWLRMLDKMQQEIVGMKTQLAEIVKGNVSKDVLDQLEEYQSVFLIKDTVIAFFRKDIQILKQHINKNNSEPININKLRTDLDKLGVEFYSMKKSYEEYIAEKS